MGGFFDQLGRPLGAAVAGLGSCGPDPADIRCLIVALASRTGWSLADLLDLTIEELTAWLEAARRVEPRHEEA